MLAQHFEGFFPSPACWWPPQIEPTFWATNFGENVGSICASLNSLVNKEEDKKLCLYPLRNPNPPCIQNNSIF